jgi:Protein-tyrosine phosphatase
MSRSRPGEHASSTLHVDFLEPAATGLPGRLGLCAAPGGWWPGPSGRDRSADSLGDDLSDLVHVHGASLLVTLLEAPEVVRLGDLPGEAQRVGLAWLHHPVPDMRAPRSPADLAPVVTRLDRHLSAGRTAVVHCLAGLGRTGTLAACLLAARGRSTVEALWLVRQARPGAVQTLEQERFVSAFEAYWRTR